MAGKKLIMLTCGALLLASLAKADCNFDHSILDRVLKANVDDQGFVDYDAIKDKKGGDLEQYLSKIQAADLTSCNEKERLAFWINAYNASMIKKILARPNLKKVTDDGKIFGEETQVARIKISQNDIENRVIRSNKTKGGPILGVSIKELNPRIHFALVCAAVDCPKLINHAYDPKTLDQTLEANAVNFANNPKHLRIEKGTLVASSILNWFGEDFDKVGGVVNFLAPLIKPQKRTDATEVLMKLKTDFPKKTSFRYDWTVNHIRNKK